MTESKPTYDPTDNDRLLAARLDGLWRELDEARAELPNDALHSDVFTDLTAAQAALQQARAKLLLSE